MGTAQDGIEAYKYLAVALERIPPGPERDRAQVNLINAVAPLTPEQLIVARERAQKFRDMLKAAGQ
jgi:hypothetical protein